MLQGMHVQDRLGPHRLILKLTRLCCNQTLAGVKEPRHLNRVRRAVEPPLRSPVLHIISMNEFATEELTSEIVSAKIVKTASTSTTTTTMLCRRTLLLGAISSKE